MTRTASTVGVKPQPKEYNARQINKLRIDLEREIRGPEDAYPKPSVAPADADHLRCETCNKSVTLLDYWFFLDSYICDGCMSELIKNGRA